MSWTINSLRPRQNRRHFADDVFKCNFLNENVWISINISLKFVPRGPINNIPALVQIMAWRRPGDKPLSKTMLVSLPTHICLDRPQWVNIFHKICRKFCFALFCDGYTFNYWVIHVNDISIFFGFTPLALGRFILLEENHNKTVQTPNGVYNF